MNFIRLFFAQNFQHLPIGASGQRMFGVHFGHVENVFEGGC